jgi:tetratricopeptide (TPR) repeat protein
MNEHDLQERKAFMEATEAFLHKSDYLTVLSLAEARLKRMPGDMDARIVICRVWIEQEKFEEAEEMLREMGDILASLSQIYTHMGDIYLKKGMPESAQTFYRMFVSVNPDTPMAREISERIKGVPRQRATNDGAIADKEEAAQVPDGLQTVTLAELYVRQGHLQMAEEVLAAILNKGPHHPKAAEMLRDVRERIAAQAEPKEEYVPVTPGDVRERFIGLDEPDAGSASEIRREVQEKIVGSDELGEKRVAVMIRDLEGLRKKLASRVAPEQKHAPVIAELSRWLNNIGRLSSHAA